MKSAIITDKKKIEIIERDIPKSDGKRVVIKVAYAGVCGSDLHYWNYGDSWAKGWIMGHEFTGYVEDPGERQDLKKGDRVVVLPSKACLECEFCREGNTTLCEAPLTEAIGIGTPGAFSEYVMVRPHLPIKLEEHIAIDEATLIEPAAVGLYAVRKANMNDSDSILVIGGGIIGLMTAMWAKHSGIKQVTMVEPGDNRRKFAAGCDFIDDVIDSKEEDFMEQIMAANDGAMYNVMFECVGIEATLNTYLGAIKSGGKIIMMGVPNEKIPFSFNPFVTRNMQMIASHAWNFKDFRDALEALDEGDINLKQFITDVKPLDEIQAVFENLTSGDTKDVKVLLGIG